MIKRFSLAVTLSLFVAASIDKVAFSVPLSTSSQPPRWRRDSNTDLPVCYLQTADGRILNLQTLCGKTPFTSSSPSSTTANSSQPSGFAGVPSFRRGSGSGYASDVR